MSHVEGVARNQLVLFPESIDDYIEEDNPVQFIDAFVDSLDVEGLGFKYSLPEATGRPRYNLTDMLKLYLYGYLNRVRSSRSQMGAGIRLYSVLEVSPLSPITRRRSFSLSSSL